MLQTIKIYGTEKILPELPVIGQLIKQPNVAGIKDAAKCVFKLTSSSIFMVLMPFHVEEDSFVEQCAKTAVIMGGVMAASGAAFNALDSMLTTGYNTLLFAYNSSGRAEPAVVADEEEQEQLRDNGNLLKFKSCSTE